MKQLATLPPSPGSKERMLVHALYFLYSVQDQPTPLGGSCWEQGFRPRFNFSGNAITDYPRDFSPSWFKYYWNDKIKTPVLFLVGVNISMSHLLEIHLAGHSSCGSHSLENPGWWQVHLLLCLPLLVPKFSSSLPSLLSPGEAPVFFSLPFRWDTWHAITYFQGGSSPLSQTLGTPL